MSFQTAAVVAGVAFLLSFLAGLVGGVPFFDIVLRALLWGALAFGGSLGVEALLRALVPDLFVPPEEPAEEEPVSTGRNIDISLEEDLPKGSFVEEVDDSEPAPRRRADASEAMDRPVEVAGPAASGPPVAPPSEITGEEEMPEIGSFLDAFKPEAPEPGEGAASAPEFGEYAPVEPDRRSGPAEVTIDGETQDPAVLAKAVQTVMKRDAQGN